MGNILLIEDDPWSRDSLAMFFRIVECRMRSVASAKEAITAMSRDRFDLILCEYQLPGMSGLTLLKIFGNIQPKAVKFLFTAYPIQKLAEEAARSANSRSDPKTVHHGNVRGFADAIFSTRARPGP